MPLCANAAEQSHAEGEDKPNKKFYDPRVWIRKSEESAVERLGEAFADLNSVGVLA
jgi:fructose-bisphosphate aldolase class II